MGALKWFGIAVGILALVAVGLTIVGAARWERETGKLLDQLESARLPPATPRYDACELAGLPAPVQRSALLPSQGVRWDAVDERSARARLVDGALSLTLLFRFDEQGLIESVRAEARGRTVAKSLVMTPWEGRWSDYQVRDGMRVPTAGEVAWLAPQGRKPYWRGTITSLQYEYAR